LRCPPQHLRNTGSEGSSATILLGVPGELHDHGVYVTGISDSLQRSCAREKGACNDSGQDGKGASNDNTFPSERTQGEGAADQEPRRGDRGIVFYLQRAAEARPPLPGGGNLCELFETENRVLKTFCTPGLAWKTLAMNSYGRRDETCPVSTGGGTGRVQSVREGGGGGGA